jgi:hypothetical protein
VRFGGITSVMREVGVAAKDKTDELLVRAYDKYELATERMDFLRRLTEAEHKVRSYNPVLFDQLPEVLEALAQDPMLTAKELKIGLRVIREGRMKP